MCALYRNRYVIGSKRLAGFDYKSAGKYFITICTKNKTQYFGNVKNGKMELSEYGIIARDSWIEIPDHCSNIGLDEFVIMPDHIHGIISINANPYGDDGIVAETRHASFLQPIIQNRNQSIIPDSKSICNGQKIRISPKPGSLGSIIGSYKSVVSKMIHRSDPNFKWQSRFYDHIIRSDAELCRIRKYIRENPQKWSVIV